MPETETNKLKRQSITLDTKIAVLKLLDEGYSIRKVAEKLKITRGSVLYAKNTKDGLLKEDESMRSMKMAWLHGSTEVNTVLWRWFSTARANGYCTK